MITQLRRQPAKEWLGIRIVRAMGRAAMWLLRLASIGDKRRSDISRGWQEREAKLRDTIRTCKHDRGRARNDGRVWYCLQCGRHLNDDGSER